MYITVYIDPENEDKKEIVRLQNEVQKHKRNEIKNFKIISTLQNLLENEVIRSEEVYTYIYIYICL
jgi:hypothetical protein